MSGFSCKWVLRGVHPGKGPDEVSVGESESSRGGENECRA